MKAITFTFDGSVLKEINLTDGTSQTIANLDSVMVPDGRLQLSESFIFVKSDDNRLFRINRETGAYEVILSDLLGSFLVASEKLYVSIQDAGSGTLRAKLFGVGADAPLCLGEASATADETGCVSFARWIIADRYTENGVSQLPLLMHGKETETKETDGNGDEQTVTHPPQTDKYLNTPDLYVFDTSTGLGQLALGSVNGYVSVNEIEL